MARMRRLPIPSLLVILLTALAQAQSCPPADGSRLDASAPSTLHGTVRYHDGTRPWLGFIPDQHVCGASEIELAFGSSSGWRTTKRLRGCPATVYGTISNSPSAYYSTDLNFFNPKITPDAGCHLLPADPDYATVKIPDWVNDYQLTVFTDVQADKPLKGQAVSGGVVKRPLNPWEAYAQVSLNGEKDLDVGCRSGFLMVSYSSVPPDASEPAPFFKGWARIYSSDLGPASLTIKCRRK